MHPRKGKPWSGEGWCSRLSRRIVYTCWFNQTVTTAPYQLKCLSRSLVPKITRWKQKRLARRYLLAARILSRMALSFASAASAPARRKHLYSHAPSWWKSILSLRNPEDIWPFCTEKHGKIKEILTRGHRCFLGNQSEYRTMTSYLKERLNDVTILSIKAQVSLETSESCWPPKRQHLEQHQVIGLSIWQAPTMRNTLHYQTSQRRDQTGCEYCRRKR